ncbi:hypothetical protein LC048_15930 [Mesobacillus subterraneus]|nr:hypothetical protein [Mesobacillus subterraneus]WLR53976.1 hypothetical protein LC048_15930 [Mesobacillus subterraneus]
MTSPERTEATRGARRWSSTTEKRKRLGQPRQALEGRPVKSFFDFT